jgi:hypothetical protein
VNDAVNPICQPSQVLATGLRGSSSRTAWKHATAALGAVGLICCTHVWARWLGDCFTSTPPVMVSPASRAPRERATTHPARRANTTTPPAIARVRVRFGRRRAAAKPRRWSSMARSTSAARAV